MTTPRHALVLLKYPVQTTAGLLVVLAEVTHGCVVSHTALAAFFKGRNEIE
jgi:hypothetical protein